MIYALFLPFAIYTNVCSRWIHHDAGVYDDSAKGCVGAEISATDERATSSAPTAIIIIITFVIRQW